MFPFSIIELIKIADHADDRLRERTSLPGQVLDVLRKRAKGVEMPRGTHHVVLPDGSFAVMKEVGRNQPKHVVATVLGRDMSPPGEDITHLVLGGKINERAHGEEGFGRNQRHQASSHFRQFPNGYEASSSFSQVKVASANTYAGNKLATLLYPKQSVRNHIDRMNGELEILHIDIEDIPMLPPAENTDPSVRREFEDMMQVMEDKPLSDAMVKKADDDTFGIYVDLCNSLDLDPMYDNASIIAEDLAKIGLIVKYAFLRPRPDMLAPFFGKKITPLDTDTADSPSYPSGHALVGYGLAKFYSELYPQHVDQFYSAADAIAVSRIQAGLHLPSDTAYSKLLSDFLLGPDTRTPKVQQKKVVVEPVKVMEEKVQPKEQPIDINELMTYDLEPPKKIEDDLETKTASIKPIRVKMFNNLDKLARR